MNYLVALVAVATTSVAIAKPPKPVEKSPNVAKIGVIVQNTHERVKSLDTQVQEIGADVRRLKTDGKLDKAKLSRLDEIATSNTTTHKELSKVRDSVAVIATKLKTLKDSDDEVARLAKLVLDLQQRLDAIQRGIKEREDEVKAIAPKNPNVGGPFAEGSRWVGTLIGPRGVLTSEWTVSENAKGRVSGTIILAGGREVSQFEGTLRNRTLVVEQFMTPTGVRGRTIAQFTLTSDGAKFNGVAVGKLPGTSSGKFTLAPKK